MSDNHEKTGGNPPRLQQQEQEKRQETPVTRESLQQQQRLEGKEQEEEPAQDHAIHVTKQTTAKNLSIVASIRVLMRSLTFVITIILAWMLDPEDYGIVGISAFFVNFLMVFQDFGIGNAVIYQKKNIEKALATGFTIRFFVAIVLYIVTFAAAPLWAALVDDGRVTEVLRVISLLFIIESFVFLPRILVRKNLKFKKTLVPQTARTVVFAAVAICLAYQGYSYWSLVYGQLAGAVVEVVLWKKTVPWKFKLDYDRETAATLFGYGKHIFISAILLFLLLNLDNALVGVMFGLDELGYYRMAYQFGTYTIPMITHVVGAVMFPTLTIIGDNRARLAKGYIKSLELISVLAIPFAFLLFILGRDFVLIFLGDKWEKSIVLLQILAFAGMCRAVSHANSQIFLATGKTHWNSINALVNFILFLVLIYPLIQLFGVRGVALTVLIFNLTGLTISFYGATKILEMKRMIVVKKVGQNIFAAVIMTGIVYLIQTRIYMDITLTASQFFLCVGVGLLAYAFTINLMTKGEFIREIKNISRSMGG